MPLFEQPEVSFHRLTKAKFISLAVTVGADYLAPILCQQVNPGLPLVVPATFVMDAAWAAQPDFQAALVSNICRHLALVESGVPHTLNDLVIWVS